VVREFKSVLRNVNNPANETSINTLVWFQYFLTSIRNQDDHESGPLVGKSSLGLTQVLTVA
jgi:hypothetical protein